MNENPVVALSPVQKRELFERAERAVRLPAVMIERDYWMFFEEPPSWSAIVRTLTQLEKAINGTKI